MADTINLTSASAPQDLALFLEVEYLFVIAVVFSLFALVWLLARSPQ